MSVSIVIATTLRRAVASQCVRQAIDSARAVGPDAEVILVVNGAPPDARPAVRAPELRVVHSDIPGISRARNLGASVARHDTILFTDDDVLVPPHWARTMAAALADGRHIAVAGPVTMVVEGPVTAFMEHERAFDATPLDADRARTLVTANAGYRRDLAPAGLPFDEDRHMWAAEDTELGLRLREVTGKDIRWVADAPVLHVVPDDVGQLVRRQVTAGRGLAMVHHRYADLVFYLPSAPHVYQSVLGGAPSAWRRCVEVVDPEVRRAYATLAFLRQVAQLAGYLDITGELLGTPVVDLDADGLRDALAAVFTAPPEPEEGWNAVPIRFGAKDPADIAATPAPPFRAIAAALREYAPLRRVSFQVQAAASQDDLAWLTRRADRDETLRQRLAGIDLEPLTLNELEVHARAVGFSVPEALGFLERGVLRQAAEVSGAEPATAGTPALTATVPAPASGAVRGWPGAHGVLRTSGVPR